MALPAGNLLGVDPPTKVYGSTTVKLYARDANTLEEQMFEVFFSHNSADKPLVRKLAFELEQRGVRVWLDERELVPGGSWQDELERVIETIPAAAVLIGPSGIGPWEVPELRACLTECVDRHLSIIPVLLPGAPREIRIPLFLRQFNWIDLRAGITEEGLARLVWGIRGEKPSQWTASERNPVDVPAPRTESTRMEGNPAQLIWRQKLAYLQQQEAIASAPAVKFELQTQIAEAKAKIQELESQPF